MNHMQKLELTWIGKGEEPAVEPRILLHTPDRDYGDPAAENMLIHGDNLLALKALEQEYAGRVKCIYIDPPFSLTCNHCPTSAFSWTKAITTTQTVASTP
jgi:hypothetical protein